MLVRYALVAAACALQLVSVTAEDTGRDLLFSDPTADLPDVVLSESVVYVNEGGSFYYTVKLSHKPGVREDATVDLLNDEVRIYLTSSQEVYQQGTGTSAGSTDFTSMLGHRSQLQINTNVYKCGATSQSCSSSATGDSGCTADTMRSYTTKDCFVDGFNPMGSANAMAEEASSFETKGLCRDASTLDIILTSNSATNSAHDTRAECEALGHVWEPVSLHYNNPLPYVYVAYSTVTPSQASVQTAAGVYDKVCPLCTHPLYCKQGTAAEGIIPGSNQDPHSSDGTFAEGTTASFDGCLKATYLGFAPHTAACAATSAVATSRMAHNAGDDSQLTLNAVNVGDSVPFCANANSAQFTGWSYKQGSVFVRMVQQTVMGVGVPPASDNGQLSPRLYEHEGDEEVLGWFPASATGGVAARARTVGNSDYRLTAAGVHTTRKVAADDTKCRYCAEAGLQCDSTDNTPCAPVEISGGDTAAGYCLLPAISPTALTSGTITATAGSESFAFENAAALNQAGFRAGDIITIGSVNGQVCNTAAGTAGVPAKYVVTGIASDKTLQVAGQTVLAHASNPEYCTVAREAQRSGQYTSKYTCEAAGLTWDATGWRGDLSSGAQLVFDSSNWNIPQTVQVTARDDDVYEPEVFGRGQDAYVHHFVVAQDRNLEHTYYDDIDVNALTVSVTDDDAALVLQEESVLTPTEAQNFLEVSSAGCTDPRRTEYNDCTQNSICLGACALVEESISDSMGALTVSAGVDPAAARAQLVGGSTSIPVSDAQAAMFQVGDTVIIQNGASACAAAGSTGSAAYQISAISGASGSKVLTTSTNLQGSGNLAASNCLISRACPVYVHSTQALCQATSNNQAACFTDSTGTAKVTGTATDFDTRAECQGTAGSSKHGVTGTCEGWLPKMVAGAAATCADTGSECADKAACIAAGHTWTPRGYAWIGDNGPNSASAFIWTANTWSVGADEIKIRLASEPMYDVTVYMQSGQFFADGTTPSAANALPDDEQLIFQDAGQFNTCYDTGSNGQAVACDGSAAKVRGCDANGIFVTSQSYYDQTGGSPEQLPTTAHNLASCALLSSQTSCEAAMSSGCAWASNACSYDPATAGTKAKDLMCQAWATALKAGSSVAESDCVKLAGRGCEWNGAKCFGKSVGYDCNSFLTFSPTNWHTWQTVKVIAVPDDDDEVATLSLATTVVEGTETLSYGATESKIGYLITSEDWYYTSPGAHLIDDVVTGYSYDYEGSADSVTVAAGGLVATKDALLTGPQGATSLTTDRACTAGEYHDVATTSSGSPSAHAKLTVVCDGSNVVSVTVTDSGAGYSVGNTLVIATASLPGLSGSDTVVFTLTADDINDGRGIFDTRFGDHIPRYPAIAGRHSTTPQDITAVTASDGTDGALVIADTSLFVKGDIVKVVQNSAAGAGVCHLAGVLPDGGAVTGGADGLYTVGAVASATELTVTADIFATQLSDTLLYASSVNPKPCQLVHVSCLSTGAMLGETLGRNPGSSVCAVSQNFATTVANNQVCTDTWETASIVPRQSTQFAPDYYTTDGASCGAMSHTQDTNVRGVVVSRHKCEATEGRRYYYTGASNLQARLQPSVGETRSGLYVPDSENIASALKATTSISPIAATAVNAAGKTFTVASGGDVFVAGDVVQITDSGTGCQNALGFYTVDSATGTDIIMDQTIGDGQNPSGATDCRISRPQLSVTAPGDYWTARNVLQSSSETAMAANTGKTMSMPTCPFTVGLTSAPAEGKTVVVTLHEDFNTADLRDNELYFFEEPTFREVEMDNTVDGVLDDDTTCTYAGSATTRSCAEACDLKYPGSVGLSAADVAAGVDSNSKSRCFINNVPCTGTAGDGNCAAAVSAEAAASNGISGAVFTAASAMALRSGDAVTIEADTTACDDGAPGNYRVLSVSGTAITLDRTIGSGSISDVTKCKLSRPVASFVPNGGKSINLKFTDDDWNIPRRITVIALNDDVDEPHETRNVYFTMGYNADGTWVGAGSDPSLSDDIIYRDAPRGQVGAASLQAGDGTPITVAPYDSGPVLPVYSGYQSTAKTDMGPGQWKPPTTTSGNTYITTGQVAVTVVDDDIADLVVLCGQNQRPGPVIAATDGTTTRAAASGTGEAATTGTRGSVASAARGFAVGSQSATSFIGSYDDALYGTEANKIVGLDEDGTVSRAGYSAEDGLAYQGEYSFGGGDAGGSCTIGTVGDCGPNYGIKSEIKAGVATCDDSADGSALSGTGFIDAGFGVGDIVELTSNAQGTCAAAGTYTISAIGSNTQISFSASFSGIASTGAQCSISRAGGYISGVTLTAADRDIASPGAAAAAPCAGSSSTANADSRCYPDSFVHWQSYDPYTDKYFTNVLSGSGAAAANFAGGGGGSAVDAPFIGTATALTSPASVAAGSAGSGKFILGTSSAVDGFKVGDRVLVTGTTAACVVDGAYTVKAISNVDYSLTVKEVVATCNTACSDACKLVMADAADGGQVRGFKGLGPARTEGVDEYACTVHTRECTKTADGFCYTVASNAKDSSYATEAACIAVAGKAWGYWTDSEDKACEKANVGSFQIRLNSSPGQKSVRRQYLGESTTVTEKELVAVVVTPDATAQTSFEPASVTFTETGGIVDGKPTQKWDAPVTIDVRPVDDKVDERQGVLVDFTAFSIRQSHETDEYWTYTTSYQTKPTADEAGEVGYCKESVKTCTAATCAVPVVAVNHGTHKLQVADASGFKVGDPIHLAAASGAACASASGNGPTDNLVIKSIANNLIELTTDTSCTYATSAGVTACGSASAGGATAETGYSSGDCVLYRGGKAACSASLFVDYPNVGTAHTWNSATTFRATDATPYRHTIRTVHTLDNDFAGVTVASGMAVTSESCTAIDASNSGHVTLCTAAVGEAACVGMVSGSTTTYVPEGGTAICKYTAGPPTSTGHLHANSHIAITGGATAGDTKLLISTVTAAQKKFTFANTGANKVMPIGGGSISTTADALLGSASSTAGLDLTETITAATTGNEVTVPASEIVTSGSGTGLALEYSTTSTTAIGAIQVTSGGSGYRIGDTVTVLASAMPGRSTDLVFTLVADDIVGLGAPGFEVGDKVVVEDEGSCASPAATDGTGCCQAKGTYTVATVDTSSTTGFITVEETVLPEQSPAVQCKISRPAVKAGEAGAAVVVPVTEGGTYGYYTLQLDTQPAKIQRQAGTDPNTDLVFNPSSTATRSSLDGSGPTGNDASGSATGNTYASYDGAEKGDYYGDYTRIARPSGKGTTQIPGYSFSAGSVEQPEEYWVDVTATQTIQIDLATPPSCPSASGAAPWGGGSSPPTTVHPRFPFNGKAVGSGDPMPYDEVNDLGATMDKYLTTCGGWQRDATYRFTATNWNVPQFVYFYAHNDADGSRPGGHVGASVTPISAVATSTISNGAAGSGSFTVAGTATDFANIAIGDTVVVTNADSTCTGAACCAAAGTYTVRSISGTYVIGVDEAVVADTAAHCNIERPAYPGNNALAGGSETVDSGQTTYDTTVKHYVETEDTMDNMKRSTGFVQRSKHGGLYTWGNIERYPFGRVVESDSQNALDNLHETGFTTYGYTSYESLYGYVKHDDNTVQCNGRTGMSSIQAYAASGSAVAFSAGTTFNSKTMTFTVASDLSLAPGDIVTVGTATGTCSLTGTYTVHSATATKIVVVEQATHAQSVATGGTIAANCNIQRAAGVYKTFSGVAATASTVGSATACSDLETGTVTPYLDEAATTQADAGGGDLCVPYNSNDPCIPRFAEDSDVETAGVQTAAATGANTALNQPPKDVVVRITDNDVITEQTTASVPGCRSTQLFQFAQTTADSVGQQTSNTYDGDGVFKKQWLTDYNCLSGDAGGLPGYPVEVASDGFDGYCTLSTQTARANCEAAQYCSVAGVCQYANAVFNARVEAECGVCTGIVAGEGTGAARFTESECIKDVDGDGTADGTWSTTGYTWTASTSSNCGSQTGYTATSAAGDQQGELKNHVWVPRPLGDAAISQTWSTSGNYQCCSCVPAYGSTMPASTFAQFDTESTCTTDSTGAREGSVWQCSGVGPYCTTAPGFLVAL